MSDDLISRLSWSTASFSDKFRLFFAARRRFREDRLSSAIAICSLWKLAEAHSALSSTYYSIAATAKAQCRMIWGGPHSTWVIPFLAIKYFFTWLPLGAWCYWRMLHLSNWAAQLVGEDNLTAEQLDVRQSILRARGRYGNAMRCIELALGKNPSSPHTRGLLYMARVNLSIAPTYADWLNDLLAALQAAKEAESYDPRQAARVYRQIAGELQRHDDWQSASRLDPDALLARAIELAEMTSAEDQSVKLAALSR